MKDSKSGQVQTLGSVTSTAVMPLAPFYLPGVHAYAEKSVTAGEVIQFRISSDGPYRLSVVRLGWDIAGPTRDWVLQQFPDSPGGVQPIYPGSYVHVPNGLPPATAFPTLSLECWVRPWAHKWQGLISQYTFQTDCGFGLFLDPSGHPVCYFGNGGSFRASWLLAANTQLPLTEWTHLVAVFRQGTSTLWVNGEQVAAVQGGPSVVNPGSAPLRLAAYGGSGFTRDCLDGDLAMPVIYQRALSAAEIKARAITSAITNPNAQPPAVPGDRTALLGCWPMTEEQGQTLADASPNARDGQIVNRATWMIGGPSFDAKAVNRFLPYNPSGDSKRGHALRFSAEDLFDCRWNVSQAFAVPPDAPSGLYVGRIQFGQNFSKRYDVTFLVKTRALKPKAGILVLCATNTWLAYNVFFPSDPGLNDWGNNAHGVSVPNAPGFNLYEGYRDSNAPTYQMGLKMPWSAFPYMSYADPSGVYGHLVRAERPLHVWLEQNGYEYDLASDLDLHRQPDLLAGYKVVVINGHSEYWSAQAYQAVKNYLAASGSVVVLSGNTMFWRVSFDADADVMECRKLPTGSAGGLTDKVGEIYHSHDRARGGLMRECDLPAWRVIGLESVGYGYHSRSFAVKEPSHPFFTTPETTSAAVGTLLAGGEVYHEYDVRLSTIPAGAPKPTPTPPEPRLLAQASPEPIVPDIQDAYWDYHVNVAPRGVLSEMIDWERAAGGRVFAAGAIGVSGKLASSPKLGSLLRNVLHHFGLSHRLNFLAVSSNGRVRNKWHHGDVWGPSMYDWQDLGGNIQGPLEAVNWSPDNLALMGVGPDSLLQYKWWDGAAWWPSPTEWLQFGGPFKGRPCAVGWGRNRLHLFAHGLNNRIYARWWDGANWLPAGIHWQDLGGDPMLGPPAAISWHGTRLSVAAIGPNRQLMYKLFDGADPNPQLASWYDMGGVNFTYGPAMIAWGGNRINIFAVDGNGVFWNKWWDGSNWGPSFSGWQSLGGNLRSAPVAVARNGFELSIFAIGADGRMKVKWWDGFNWGPSLNDWQDLGGSFVGTPSAVIWRGKYMSLTGVGTDGRFCYKLWDGEQWNPPGTKWLDLSGPLAGQLQPSPATVTWVGKR